ncbi:MAG: TetR/AcrR family transcriptional regulator [Planctomycetes bacterium]|nr:TetR/AcrR family transcriptional regulator [Planctomycetota bacterium]
MKKAKQKNNELTEKRRHEILKAATDVFARNGFRCTDVQEIADTLGIGKGTIYRRFGSKEKLFFAVADNAMQMLVERIRVAAQSTSDLRERIRAVIFHYLEFFEKNRHIIEILVTERCEFRERSKPTYITYWQNNIDKTAGAIQKCIQTGIARKLDPFYTAEILHNILSGEIFSCCYRKKQLPLAKRAQAIADLFFNGILK